MSAHERWSLVSKAFSNPRMNGPATVREVAIGTDPSQPLARETSRATRWLLLLIGVGLVLTLAWASTLLWMALQALAGVIAWLWA